MDIIKQLFNINNNLNLEILDLQNELVSISGDTTLKADEKQVLIDEIYTLMGTYVVHCERINGVLKEIEKDATFIDKNLVVFNNFFNSLNDFNNQHLKSKN